jgi:hypothetical protein
MYSTPFNLATALGLGSVLHSFRGDFKRVLQITEEAMKVSSELGFPIWNIIAKTRSVWARAQSGEVGGAVKGIREALAGVRFSEVFSGAGALLCMLSETLALAGEIDEAIASVEQAWQANPEEAIYHPLILTLRGDLRLQSNAGSGTRFKSSEQDFRNAIQVARVSARSRPARDYQPRAIAA